MEMSLYSDNSTNLVGAERTLRDVIRSWNQPKIHNKLRQQEIQWSFNTPSASHMGGAWHRRSHAPQNFVL